MRAARRCLIYKNSAEGPGLLGDLFDRRKIPYAVAERARGQPLDPRGFDAVVVLGGPQSANDPDVRTQQILGAIRGIIQAGTPYLGICLGAQMLARALGAPVTRSPAPEYGPGSVRLTPAARRDPVFGGLPDPLPVFQWHGETFGIPRGGLLLARGAVCGSVIADETRTIPERTARGLQHSHARRMAREPEASRDGAWGARGEASPRAEGARARDRQLNQALRVGNAWGVQFHNEVAPAMVREWAAAARGELARAGVSPSEMMEDYRRVERPIARAGARMAENFLRTAELL